MGENESHFQEEMAKDLSEQPRFVPFQFVPSPKHFKLRDGEKFVAMVEYKGDVLVASTDHVYVFEEGAHGPQLRRLKIVEVKI